MSGKQATPTPTEGRAEALGPGRPAGVCSPTCLLPSRGRFGTDVRAEGAASSKLITATGLQSKVPLSWWGSVVLSRASQVKQPTLFSNRPFLLTGAFKSNPLRVAASQV